MRRSLLFIPGNNPSMIQNCDVFESDTVIFDLEDSVAVEQKDAARNLVGSYLNSFKPNVKEVMIRINGMDTVHYTSDVEAAVKSGADSIMLPKASSAGLKDLDELLTQLEKKHKTKKIRVVPIIELASSLVEAYEIAKSPRVDGVLLGAEDFTRDMEVQRTSGGEEIFYARSKIAVSCRAAGVEAIDTPFTSTADDEGLKADCRKAKSLGMNAKACIHPNQVNIVNRGFAPSPSEIEFAQRVLLAVEDAANEGKGAFSLDGKMIDKPILERAKTTLRKAKEFGLK